MPSEAKEQIVRHLLTAIDDDAGVSQRKLSSEMGIAVGSVNWHLKRCVNKGLIKLQQAPVKRYLYYLTPKGFEEKARLTASFVQTSFSLYRQGRDECARIFSDRAKEGNRNAILFGEGDFAEVAIVSAIDAGARIHAVVDPEAKRDVCAGVPVWPNLGLATASMDGAALDTVLVTNLGNPGSAYRSAVTQVKAMGLSPDIIAVPRTLNFKVDHEH